MYFIGTSIIRNSEIVPLSVQRETGADNEVYELFRVERKKPLFLADHLARFTNSLRTAQRELPLEMSKLKELIEWLILCNVIPDSDIRMCLSPDGLFQAGFVHSVYPTKQMYVEGVKCSVLNAIREQPTAKIFHAEMRSEAAEQQHNDNVYESVLVDTEGFVTEGSRSNIFFVSGERLMTAPDERVLSGIMRKKIVEICRAEKIEIEYKNIPLSSINQYDAAFISSTPSRILPIRAIADCTYRADNPLVVRLMSAMQKEVDRQING